MDLSNAERVGPSIIFRPTQEEKKIAQLEVVNDDLKQRLRALECAVMDMKRKKVS